MVITELHSVIMAPADMQKFILHLVRSLRISK